MSKDFDNGQINMFQKQASTKVRKHKADEKSKKIMAIQPKGALFEKTVEEVMHSSMLPYSEYVILDRALPRVEDGLKPVQRRILYDMFESGFTPDKPYVKCATIVGSVLGKYHPHGDSSVYGALVRMAQDFSINVPLIQGHGNFGSIDGDSPAAYRYTESRLTPLAIELMRDIDKNTVKYSLNYSDKLKEPDYLPGRFPNLLVNGASGIAVGLATSIPPHNLNEVIDATVALIDNPDLTLEEVLTYVKGPDFPTGGIVSAGKEMIEAYENGRGKVTIRAKFHREELPNGKTNIVITELPYEVNKSLFLVHVNETKEKIKGALNDILEINDESDKNGMRAVITCRKDADIDSIIALLIKHTEMQQNFSINMVAIANGRPKQMGIIEILKYYIDFQVRVIYKRTKYDYDKAVARAHILQGLLIAINNIDAVIKLIKSSKSTAEAKVGLMEKFNLTDAQATAILDMRLSRLTNLETYKIEEELAELEKMIEEYSKILSSRARQLTIVKRELNDIKKRFPTERKSEMVTEHETFVLTPIEKLINTECLVAVSEDGMKLKNITINAQVSAGNKFEQFNTTNVLHKDVLKTSTQASIYAFTNMGNMYKINVGDIPVCKIIGKGTNLSAITKAEVNEKIVNIFETSEFAGEGELLFFTQFGFIKKALISEFATNKPAIEAIGLRDFDRVISVQPNYNSNAVLMVSANGMSVNVEYASVPLQKRAGTGVIGMSLNEGDKLVFAGQVNLTDKLLVVTNDSSAKRVALNEFSVSARNRKGLKLVSGDEKVKYVISPVVTGELVVEDNKGNLTVKDINDIPVVSRTGAGKPIIKNKQLQNIRTVCLYLS
ncbi:MAG: DNA topoisomerase 4 subunit A [Clostridia bacterium]|nr:DNA topoisomerase 4 subunit A [Clostridia bacterium]